jgi:multidrug efflux pump
LIIMLTVLLSTIGIFGGLATFKMNVVIIMTGIGLIALAGIVVKNGIVLIDYIDLLKKRKKNEFGMEEHEDLPLDDIKDCIAEAGRVRLRPVLLTAMTTILGLIPLATGLNIDFVGLFKEFKPNIFIGGDNVAFWGPMSWAIIFGLTFSTILTLVIVPTIYFLLNRAKISIYRIWRKNVH